MALRPATLDDIDSLVSFDHVAQRSPARVTFVREGVERSDCLIAERNGAIVGFLILGRFFGHDFIDLVYVREEARRSGVGSALIAHAESKCGEKLFTSTNLSNKSMQSLLEGRGYALSGYVDNLDEGDPELIYVRSSREGTG